MVSVVTELVGSYWYKDKDANPIEFTIYGKNNNIYSYDNGGILLGINLTGYFPFDHFPSYDEVYDLIKDNLENHV